MTTTLRTHCIVCFNCEYVSDPMTESRALATKSTLMKPTVDNCKTNGHAVEVLTVAAGNVAYMLWDFPAFVVVDDCGEGPF